MRKVYVIMYDDEGDERSFAFSVEETEKAAKWLVDKLNILRWPPGRTITAAPPEIATLGLEKEFLAAYQFYYEEVPLHLLANFLGIE